MRIIFIFVLISIFASCEENKEENIFNKETFVLKNYELKEQIIKYKEFIYKADSTMINDGDSVTFHVYYKALNDSLDRFVIMAMANPELMELNPYQCVINIDGTDVFFHFACWEYNRFPKTKYIGLSNKAYENIINRYYPNAAKSINKRGYIYPQIGYEQELYYLTFLNGSLIDVIQRGGLPDDRVPVKLNGKVINI